MKWLSRVHLAYLLLGKTSELDQGKQWVHSQRWVSCEGERRERAFLFDPFIFLFNINLFFRITALKAACCPLYTQCSVNFWHILDGQIFMADLGLTSEFEVAALFQVFWFCNETLAHFVLIQLYRAILCSFSSLVPCLPRRSWWVPVFLLKNRSTWILQNKHAFKLIFTDCCQGACFPLSASW